jgi:regulator of sigma E protease
MTALIVVAIFVALIVIHELGHFFVAKWLGVRVEEFGIGYPPRAISFGRWGGTEYTINWLPLGGFVRLFGDEETKEHGKGSFQDASRTVQAAILIAGVAMNALLAWVLLAWSLHLGVPTLVQEPAAGEQVQLFIADVVPGSPAAAAGIAAGDELLSIADKKGAVAAPLTPHAVSAFVASRPGQELTVTYLHSKATTTTLVRPANGVVAGSEHKPALGVALALVATRALPWPEAIQKSVPLTLSYFKATFDGVWQLIAGAFTLNAPIDQVVGPVGLVSVIGEAAQNGFGNVIKLAGFISVNFAIINLIPIPALDGGRLAVLGVEAVLRRPAPRLAVQIINTIGVACLMLLMLVVTYHDIAKLLA